MTARFWMLTIPAEDWNPPTTLPPGISFLKGQRERGEAGGYEHWQLCVRTTNPVRLNGVKALFCNSAHAERTRSEAALAYVWKDATAVEGTRFQLGALKQAGNQTDWSEVRELAKAGRFNDLDPAILVRYTGNLLKIHAHFADPGYRPGIKATVFWGPTHTGKTHRAALEAEATGSPTFWKTSTTRWWDGYKGERNVIIDEFDGQIGMLHLLRWLDKYPCRVEIKGGFTPLRGDRFWITSNLHPSYWFPELPAAQNEALFRRIEIIEVAERYIEPPCSPNIDE